MILRRMNNRLRNKKKQKEYLNSQNEKEKSENLYCKYVNNCSIVLYINITYIIFSKIVINVFLYMEIMTIGRTIGHTVRCSHKFHIKCN